MAGSDLRKMDINDIARLFSSKFPISIDIKNTSHGDDDFREALLVDFGDEKIVVKLSSNSFTDEKRLILWERIAKEYRNLGYYCPQYIRAMDGTFPTVLYKGRNCIAWGEEFSKYRSAEDLIKDKFPDIMIRPFTMQNGSEILHGFFDDVTPGFYNDSLHITEVEDLVAYLRSIASFKAVLDLPEQMIRDILAEHVVDGAIDLPKEYGMFTCR